jgi:hypothetical protein
VDAKAGMDGTGITAPVGPTARLTERGRVRAGAEFADGPADGALFAEPPASLLSPRSHGSGAAALEDHVYRSASLNVMSCPALKLVSAPGGTEGEFRARIALALREKRDDAVDKLRRKYESKIATLADRGRRADQKVERQKAQASSQTMSSALSDGGSQFGALYGGRRSSALGKRSTGPERWPVTRARGRDPCRGRCAGDP